MLGQAGRARTLAGVTVQRLIHRGWLRRLTPLRVGAGAWRCFMSVWLALVRASRSTRRRRSGRLP